MSKGRTVQRKPNLFMVADAGVNTGFASVSHNLIDQLYKRWDINVLAINYHGDPHPIQAKAQLWNPAGVTYGDLYGLSRIATLGKNFNPDVTLMINDPWVASEYVAELRKYPGKKVLYTPIDAKNIKAMFVEELNKGFDHIIAYTQFGADELRNAGLRIPVSVIPHGIDRTNFMPLNKKETRRRAGINEDYYIVQVVDRNQVRKRIDLAIHYFAQWVHNTNKPKNVMFYYHGALRDEGWDIGQLMTYNGVADRLILSHNDLNPARGFPVEHMRYVYNLPDIKLSTTHGEGWGLTTMESMACGIANVVPNFSALGEWANGGVYYTEISNTPYFSIKGLNTQAGVPDMNSTIMALETLYNDNALRDTIGKQGLQLVSQKKYEWSVIAQQFEDVFNTVKMELDDD